MCATCKPIAGDTICEFVYLGVSPTLDALGRRRANVGGAQLPIRARSSCRTAFPSSLSSPIAGAPFADSAAAQDGWLRSTFGESCQELRAPMALWVASIWNAEVGDTVQLKHVRAALEEVARDADDPLWRRRGALFEVGAEADLARLRGDTALALETFAGLIPSVRSANWNWGLADPLAVERLRHAELLLAAGRYEEAIDVASVFDSPAAAIFTPFIPALLAIRHAAARAAGLSREERRYLERLEVLGRTDLVREPPAP